MTDQVLHALAHVPADDRDTWVKVGMALHHQFGNAGFDCWARWSQASDKWNRRTAVQQWRSFGRRVPGRPVTLGTLLHLARSHGWSGRFSHPLPPPPPVARTPELERLEARVAQKRAEDIVRTSGKRPRHHAYLARKGFAGRQWPTHADCLVVPVFRFPSRRLQSVQLIRPSGAKLFLEGGTARRGVYAAGAEDYRRRAVVCEGFATALTVRAALRRVKVRRPVVATFSDHGLRLAKDMAQSIVVADNDSAGVRAAKATGRPVVLPPKGQDLNDLMRSDGLDACIDLMRPLLRLTSRRSR